MARGKIPQPCYPRRHLLVAVHRDIRLERLSHGTCYELRWDRWRKQGLSLIDPPGANSSMSDIEIYRALTDVRCLLSRDFR